MGAGHGSRKGRHGRLGTLLFACRERAPGGVVVSVHGSGKGTCMGRSDGGLACLLEEEEEGGGKGAMEGSSAAMELLPLRTYRKQREVASGGG